MNVAGENTGVNKITRIFSVEEEKRGKEGKSEVRGPRRKDKMIVTAEKEGKQAQVNANRGERCIIFANSDMLK